MRMRVTHHLPVYRPLSPSVQQRARMLGRPSRTMAHVSISSHLAHRSFRPGIPAIRQRILSGTSMASPHVAGVAALYLQNNTTASNNTVRNAIVTSASANKLTSIGTGSPNLLLYSPLTSGGTPPPPPPPTCGGGTFTGSLSGTGANAYQPNNSYYQSTTSGTHTGGLTGPAGADFDLYLQNGMVQHGQCGHSLGSTSTENFLHGTAGTSAGGSIPIGEAVRISVYDSAIVGWFAPTV